jgi:HEAT repeat protein
MKNHVLNQIAFVGLSLLAACTAGFARERELIAVLQSDAGVVEKTTACQHLRIWGTVESVPILAAMLGDEKLGHAARYALEGMPYPDASAALRDAIGRTSGAIRTGLIDSVGRRRDTAATPLLVPLLWGADTVTAVAAASALGGIGDQTAAAALAAAQDIRNPDVRMAVWEALLRCGEVCLDQGNKSEASGIYHGVLKAEPPSAIRVAAWRGEVLSDDARRPKLVIAALTGGDEALRLAAVRLVRETKDEEIVRAGLRQWESLGAEAQALLVDTLAERGDRTALAHVLEACKSSEESVRVAGIQAISVLGDAANVAFLAERAARASGAEQAAARESLRVLRGNEVHAGMIERMKATEPAVQVELIQALADRRAAKATPVLLQMAASGDAPVRTASHRALRELAGADEVEALVALLVDAPGSERKQLESTILGVARRADVAAEASRAVLARFDSVRDVPLKCAMIGILGQLGDASALATLRGALQDANPEIQYASIASLSRWPDGAPLADLLRIARDGAGSGSRVRALRAYVELVGTAAAVGPQEKVRCYATAMDLAPDAAVKRMVFAALANVRTVESMQLAAAHVRDEQVREEAALAAVTIAESLHAGSAEPAKAALEQVVAANVGNQIKERARKTLDEIEAVRSYLVDWEVAGPYMEAGKNYAQLFDIAFEPEKPKAQVQWRKMPVSRSDPHPAYLDLLKEFGGEQRVAYLRTRIESADIRPVTLEIFSDDGVKAWLNRRVIHANNVARPILPEPDRVNVTLQKGMNTLMLKVTQNNLPWGAVVRVREMKTAEPRVGEGWRLHVINADSRFEAATAFDVNRNGKLDIVCGGYWYEAPHWKKHFLREIKEEGGYHYDFANLAMDVDGDGWIDTVGAAWHNRMLYWVRNPGKAGGPWEVFEIDTPGNMETALAYDINGDGQLDILPNIMTEAAWYEFRRDPTAPQGVRWHKHPLPKEAAGHGIGAGDVNGDGRMDIVTPRGWLEQTDDGWRWHPEFNLGHASIPILVHDVDGDGRADLIWGLGHNYGLFWLEQTVEDGRRAWKRHLIDDSWSQPHFMLLADLNNDGRLELVTGKRYYAHNGNDPGANDPQCIYSYSFDVSTRKWTRRLIHEGGRVGFGINTVAVDIDGDGDLDLIAPGKSGLYLLENLLK